MEARTAKSSHLELQVESISQKLGMERHVETSIPTDIVSPEATPPKLFQAEQLAGDQVFKCLRPGRHLIQTIPLVIYVSHWVGREQISTVGSETVRCSESTSQSADAHAVFG